MVHLTVPKSGTPRFSFHVNGQSLSDLKMHGDATRDYPDGQRLQTVKSWGLFMGHVANALGSAASKGEIKLHDIVFTWQKTQKTPRSEPGH